MRERLVWIGTILLVLGLSLVIVTSFFNLQYWKQDDSGPIILTVDKESSGDFLLFTNRPPEMKRVEIAIYTFVQFDILNSSLNYHGQSHPFTVTLVGNLGNISQTDNATLYPSYHVFDIPDNWTYISTVSISNPEDHPIILVEEARFYSLLGDSTPQTVINSGIVFSVVGVVTISVGIALPSSTRKLQKDVNK